jgi:hypothetical protein
VRSLKAQAERAAALEDTLYLAKQAKAQLDHIRSLEGMDESLDRLQKDIERLILDTEKHEDDLARAAAIVESNPGWPAQAVRLSQELRQRYPNDPAVARLNRSLGSYRAKVGLIRAGVFAVILLILGLLGWLASPLAGIFICSLTPLLHPSPISTPTPTDTYPNGHTYVTLTFTPTPTSIVGASLRDIWARSGCYEGYTATGRIPTGGFLKFLPAERRFDNFNRECVLVEYNGEDKSVIGWVLLLDIGSPPATAQP